MQNIIVSGTITFGNWDPVVLSKTLSVGGLLVVTHTAAAGASKVEVNLAALTDLDDVEFVLIQAASYLSTVPGTPDIGYYVHANTALKNPMEMFHMYCQGQLKALSTAGLVMDKIFVSNAGAADVEMQIIIGYTP
jgi:hypothetical protein